MSDFEKNDDLLKRKYGDVMDSIADDIKQINLDESADFVSASNKSADTADVMSDDFIKSISGIDFDDADAVLTDAKAEVLDDTAPLFNDSVFIKEFGSNQTDEDSELNLSLNIDDELDLLSCEDCREMLYDYVSDLTDDEESRAIDIHLKNCEMCSFEYDDIRDMIAVMHSASAPMPPSNLISGMHDRLIAVAPEVNEEYRALRAECFKSVFVKAKNVFSSFKAKVDYFIRHANWKVVAPAALSAVLVIGVASSGLYQVMKSSDEIYSFSDDLSAYETEASAKPSASGLDDYVTDKKKTSSSPKSSASPRSSALPSGVKPSALPRSTAGPAGSSALPNIGLTNGSSSSSNLNSSSSGSRSNSSSNRTTTSSSSSNRSASSSSSASSPVKTPAPTAKPYVMPNIILPDISSMINSPSPAVQPEPQISIPDVSGIGEPADTENNWSADNNTEASMLAAASDDVSGASVTAGSGGGSNISAPTPPPAKTIEPTKPPAPTAKPSAAPSVSASPVSEAERVRNDKGETELYTNIESKQIDDASVVSFAVKDKEFYDNVINSSFADRSKIEENGDVVLYLTASEFADFTKVLRESEIDYTLMVLGKNDDVKVIMTVPENK